MGKISQWLRRFMAGRYGTDKLNTYILALGVIFCLVSMFFPTAVGKLLLTALSYFFLIWAMFRTFSRNTYRRYQENRKFLSLLNRLKDRQHRYFNCPKCRQQVRVPRGKGKISITCPKCGERFIRKT